MNRPPLPRVHAITDELIARRPSLDRIARDITSAGPQRIAFHARGRELTGTDHLELAGRLPPLLFVNDRLDIALATSAVGVQLAHRSLSVADARRLGPHWWIGRSVHNLPEAQAALAQTADYLLVGPVFPTATHPDREPVGVELVARIAALGGGRPVIAIGGVTPDRVPELRAAGAYGVAAIRALWDAADPAAAAKAMLEAFE